MHCNRAVTMHCMQITVCVATAELVTSECNASAIRWLNDFNSMIINSYDKKLTSKKHH